MGYALHAAGSGLAHPEGCVRVQATALAMVRDLLMENTHIIAALGAPQVHARVRGVGVSGLGAEGAWAAHGRHWCPRTGSKWCTA